MKTEGKLHDSIITIFTISIIGLGSFPSFMAQIEAVKTMDDTYVAQYIRRSSTENDTVLLWGAESAYNFASQRKSPSKYVYQYPLYTEGFVDSRRIEGFLSDIRQNQPALIIDTKNELTPFLAFPLNTEEIELGVSFIKMHYQQKEKLGEWDVYEFIPFSN